MADLVHAFLEDVRSGLARDMSRASVEAVLVETEAHLRERISALVELGVSEEAAAREAIAAFGAAESYASEIVEAREPTRESLTRTMVWVAIAASAVAVAAPLIAIASLWSWFSLLPVPLLIGLFAVSHRSRRAIPFRLAAVAGGAYVSFVLLSACVMLPIDQFGGAGILPRWEVDEVRSNLGQNTNTRQEALTLRRNRFELLGATDPIARAGELGLLKKGKLLAPTGSLSFDAGAAAEYKLMSPVDGLIAWKNETGHVSLALSSIGDSTDSTLEAIRRAEQASYGQLVFSMLPECHPLGGIWLFALLLANSLGAMVGAVRYRFRGYRLRIQIARE